MTFKTEELLYRLYFTFGAIMLLLTISLFISILHKQRYKTAPLGCLMNLLVPSIFTSIRYFTTGFVYLKYGEQYSALTLKGFGLIDGWCAAEGLMQYTFFIMKLVFFLLWQLDFVLTLKYPQQGREQHIFIYMAVGYFGSILISTIIFFNIYNYFGLTSQATCFVVEGPVYHAVVNLPIFIVFVVFLLTYCKYHRKGFNSM